jgi:glycosyltransferase involved in cell wall biosynthesis
VSSPPLVSVVMPVLDAEPWLAEAIDSILAQTHRDLELIVVDDGSEDGSRAVAADFAGRDRRVRSLALPRDPNSTTSGRAANAGVAAATGAFVARMDADDIALPDRLAAQIAFLERGGLDGCGGLAEAFGTEERSYWFPETGEGIDRELIFRVGILHPTLMVRTEALRRLRYSETASHEDYEWQVRARAAGLELGNLQEVVLRHRTHAAQANRRHRDLFLRDLRRYRFSHVMRLFPGTRAEDYQPLAWLAEGARLRGVDELEKVRTWLLRLADQPEPRLRASMARRWDKACDRTDPPPSPGLRERIREEILQQG